MFGMGVHIVDAGTLIMGDGSIVPPQKVTPDLKTRARHVVEDGSMIVGTSSIWMTRRKKEELDNAIRRRTRR